MAYPVDAMEDRGRSRHARLYAATTNGNHLGDLERALLRNGNVARPPLYPGERPASARKTARIPKTGRVQRERRWYNNEILPGCVRGQAMCEMSVNTYK